MKHLTNNRWLRLLTFLLIVCAASFVGTIAVQAETTGSIKGTVVDDVTGNPVFGIYVGASSDLNEDFKATVQTGADGSYVFSGLQFGTYKIYFLPYKTAYIAQWYNAVATFQEAQPVELTSENSLRELGETRLVTGATISGTITDALSGSPISGITVQAFDISDSEIWFSTITDTNGNYSIAGLRAGTYKVRFRAFGTNYITAWYYDGNDNHADPDESNATSVVINGSPVLIDAKLTAGSSISGKVTIQETRAVLSGARVNVYSSPDNILKGYATTGEQGTYTVSGLPAGRSYKVQFFERVVNNAGAGISTWYNSKSDFAAADLVDVGAENIDAVFSGAVISGTIRGQENVPLPNVTVKAYDSGDNIAATVQAGADGVYKIKGLKRGSYKLYFQPLSDSGYASEWHNDQATMTLANAVAVASLGDKLTIDAVMQKEAIQVSNAAKLIPIYKQLLLKKR